MKDDQNDDETHSGIDAFINQEQETLPSLNQHWSKGWKVLERVKAKQKAEPPAKKLSEAEQFFNQYCYPDTWFWEYWEWKQAALDIISSRIREGNELKGHARRQNHPVVNKDFVVNEDVVVLGDLIIDLVEKHFDYEVNLPPGRVFHRLEGPLEKEIVNEFDDHFRFVAAIARLGGIRSDSVQNIWDDWRKQVSTQVVKGKISPRWRQVIMNEIFPGYTATKKIAYEFADIFLRYVAQAPTDRIAEWVNLTLKSLGRRPVSKSSLNYYISNKKQQSPVAPISITE